MNPKFKELLLFEQEYTAFLKRSTAITDTAVANISEGIGKVGTALGKAAAADITPHGLKLAPVEHTQQGAADDSLNPFWFMKKGKKKEPETDYGAAYIAKKNQYDNLIALAREHSSKKIQLKEEEFTALKGFDELHESYIASKTAMENRAYSAMEKQMLRLVEVKRFSVKAFGTAIAQQVKMELVGMASKAAVWSLYEVAMGFMSLGTPGMQGLAALHFKSAAQFAAVSGASLLGAAAIQSAVLGGAKKENAAGSGGNTANSLKSTVPVNNNVSSEPVKQVQHVTVVINNPLSEQNWDQITENNIIPAINAARDRNIELEVVSV